MEKGPGLDTNELRQPPTVTPMRGLVPTEERLRILAPQWERIFQSLRTMDEATLGEIEPSTLFVWGTQEP